ncbi:MAG: hypothetical protein MMC33_002668 [Icmadophila ericetorum]|nr:hypothetical protein [Icmadophila ericetorum]
MARKDIDAICGSEDQRLPSMADMANIPYVYALIKELLRWRPAVLMIPSHELTQDLDFECYHFSKGTNFLINTITVCNKCEDPEDFKPQRWLDEHVGNITNGVWQFGGGRRVCPGYKVAQQGLFVALARLIYGFDYIANGAYDSHRLNNKRFGEPFPVKMSVRSKEHEELIIKEAIHFDVLGSAKMEF